MNKEDIELRSVEFQEIIGKVPHWIIRSGIAIIFSFLVSGLFIVNFLHYPDKIHSRATVSTTKPTSDILSPTQGYIIILKKSNTEVQEGETVGYIENRANYDDVLVLADVVNGALAAKNLNEKLKQFEVDANLQLGELQIDYLKLANLIQVSKLNHSTENQKVLLDIQIYLRQIKDYINQWKAKYVMTAPTNGKFYVLPNIDNKVLVAANQSVFKIFSDEKSLIVAAAIPIQSSAGVAVGQQVLIKLDNYPHEEFGFLTARVTSISSLPVNETYIAKASLENGLVTTRKIKIQFKQGMSGVGEIITKDYSVLQRIFRQFNQLFK